MTVNIESISNFIIMIGRGTEHQVRETRRPRNCRWDAIRLPLNHTIRWTEATAYAPSATNGHGAVAFGVEIENENRRWIDWVVQFNKTVRNRILTTLTLHSRKAAHTHANAYTKTADRRMRYVWHRGNSSGVSVGGRSQLMMQLAGLRWAHVTDALLCECV